MSFRVRMALAADVPAMHRIRMAVVENRLSEPGRVTEESYLPYVREGSAWIAERGGEAVGFAIVDTAARSVWALFVDPAAEGSGVGTALHARMLSRARSLGFASLALTTSPGTRAETFYLAKGWKPAGGGPGGELRLELVLR